MAVLSSRVCALYRKHAFTGLVSKRKAQYTDMQVRALTHIARAQTNKLIEGSGNGNCVTQTIHIAILTFNIFPFVVIVLFQIQRSVSRTADKHNNKKTKKTLHQELQSQKIK